MTISEYFAAVGSHLKDEDAESIGPVLTKLASQGKSSAQDIVAAAHSKRSRLHRYFEWDDAEAAKEYRLAQARYMARSIMVRVVDDDGRRHELRAFLPVHLKFEDGGRSDEKHFQPIAIVARDSDYAQEAIQDAWRHLKTFQQRYSDYRDLFAPVFDAISELEQKQAA
jgi:hypothetical protein